jgi:HPt (histidine-containing phosphotransfer) domain-containing protein
MNDSSMQLPGTDAEPANDIASLERLRRFGGNTLLGKMVDIYLETAPQRVAAARAGLAVGDAEEVERALHSLKSSSAQLGAFPMQRLCERGEREARAGSLANAPAVLAAIDAELPGVLAWLDNARREEPA